jgi:predicted SpoU family rRNA methylase
MVSINTITYLDTEARMMGAVGLSFKRRNEERSGETIQKGGSKAGGDFFVSHFEREPHGPSDLGNTPPM